MAPIEWQPERRIVLNDAARAPRWMWASTKPGRIVEVAQRDDVVHGAYMLERTDDLDAATLYENAPTGGRPSAISGSSTLRACRNHGWVTVRSMPDSSVSRDLCQSPAGSGSSSNSSIGTLQHSNSPSPPVVQRTSVPQFWHLESLAGWLAIPAIIGWGRAPLGVTATGCQDEYPEGGR